MAESVYKVIELIGTSAESWEKAAAAAVETAAQSLRDLRIAEVVELDLQIEDGKVLPTGPRSRSLSSTCTRKIELTLW
jgi:flavin-binding protein dodecin